MPFSPVETVGAHSVRPPTLEWLYIFRESLLQFERQRASNARPCEEMQTKSLSCGQASSLCKFLAWQRGTTPQAASRPAPLQGSRRIPKVRYWLPWRELRRKPVRGGSLPPELKLRIIKTKGACRPMGARHAPFVMFIPARGSCARQGPGGWICR